jgi:hypothetical protein
MNFSMSQQLELRLLGRLDGPSVVPDSHVKACHSYRDAVRLCWALRRVKAMTTLTLSEQAGFPSNHRSDYLSDDEDRRELPAKYIKAFEAVCGNTAISQWIAMGAKLTILEEIQAGRLAA